MDLQEVTPSQLTDTTTVHAGRADQDEVARLIAEPHAVLREAGIDVAPGTPVHVEVRREETREERLVGVGVIVIIIGPIVIVIVIIVVLGERA
jgi:hypothetical protein